MQLAGYKDYRKFLGDALAEKISRNKSFSLRAFAKHLGINHSMLVQVLKGTKNLSAERAYIVGTKLALDKIDHEYFCTLVQLATTKNPSVAAQLDDKLGELIPNEDRHNLSVDHFKMMSEWYYLPILQCFYLTNFESTPRNVAKKLSLTAIEVETAFDRLMRLELIEKDKSGKYKRVKSRVLADSAVPNDALRKFHRQMLEKAVQSLETQTPKEKLIGSETLAFDVHQLETAKKITEEYFTKMSNLAKKGRNKQSIYHLSVCFFNLTPKE